ncbi:hypothetical protein B0H14DRAFT_3427659 [Mycena olivaceomarginata]|nr:hypothetical protein B0H14DRAFT_3427659 [Mycena olivaceomarginata]
MAIAYGDSIYYSRLRYNRRGPLSSNLNHFPWPMVFHYLPPIQADPPDDPVIYQNTYAETPTGADPVQVRIGPIFFHYLHLFQAAPPDDLPVDQRTDAEMLTRADPVQSVIPLQHFINTIASWSLPVGFETITVAIEVFAILLQIARIIEPILQDPRATALRAMNGDNPSPEFFSYAESKAIELGERFDRKPRYFLDLFFQGGARMMNHHDKINPCNAFKSEKAAERREGLSAEAPGASSWPSAPSHLVWQWPRVLHL